MSDKETKETFVGWVKKLDDWQAKLTSCENPEVMRRIENHRADRIVTDRGFELFQEGDNLTCRFELMGSNGISIVKDSIQHAEERDDPVASDDWQTIEGIDFSPDEVNLFNMLEYLASNGSKQTQALVRGNSGYGKSARAKAWAEKTGREFFRLNVPVVTSPERLFGERGFEEGVGTVFIPTRFTEIMRNGNALVLLDEVNRVAPSITNPLMSILDDARETVLTNNEVITAGDNIIVVGTINEGYNYTGTDEIDFALRSRFGFQTTVGPLPFEREVKLVTRRWKIAAKEAKKIVKTMNRLRIDKTINENGPDISTRTTLFVAQAASTGASLLQAFTWAVINKASDPGIVKAITDVVKSEIGND